VPVFVDALIASARFPIVRCSYLTIETDDPAPDWRLILGRRTMPMLLLGFQAIVRQPLNAQRFAQPGDFEHLLQSIESRPGWLVQTSDLWFPAELFKNPSPGQVYRVGQRLFWIALRHRNGVIGQEAYLAAVYDQLGDVQFSEVETDAFQRWHTSVMDEEPIDKNPDYRLRDRGAQ
jgi:hypothetical protein